MTGRPSKYSPEMAKTICEGLIEGRGLRDLCKDVDISLSTVFLWLQKHKTFSEQYAQARKIQAEVMADELKAISDENPTCEIPTKSGDTFTSTDRAGVDRNRLRVDTRKWIASRLLPKVYGDKVAVTGGNEGDKPVRLIIERQGYAGE